MAQKVAIIMAAGQSTRMNTKLPKVLHEVCGRPMLSYVLDACRQAGVDRIIIVVGYGKEQIIDRFGDQADITFVEQKEQKGTGHAVMCCRDELERFKGQTLILCGDAPLIRSETLKTLIEKHEQEKSAATLATTILDNPAGYGRIVRDSYGNIQGIVEHNDCTDQQLQIKEVNPGYFCFETPVLLDALKEIKPNNVKNEYYLTDALHITIATGGKVTAVTAVAPEDAMGVNNRRQLSQASKIMQERIQDKLMDAGVTIVDPPNTWIDVRAQIGQDTVIEPFTYIHGQVSIGTNCRIGPFAFLRNGTQIGDDVVLGVFTEIKNTRLADGVRARHHSYLGDAEIEANSDIGAGALTANFDGQKIQKTKIGPNTFVGPGAVLVAPIEIGPDSHLEPGKVVTQKDLKKG
ncbi:Bifunctional protein GlmU [Anaerohalosphaera lusitana]|uniref:Bifunctional protein GlmU n=1 Tax=Anaerohalosphaera lusitana TaxID=1936003 RepID=A0A1U9NHW5_9BACT|nr:NTP transferase domain-containing protein [Anaerohalosphaera lusitana]AQT67324.1 Bifunctional protein GlmU [Anaerohalosphaera lusitana]